MTSSKSLTLKKYVIILRICTDYLYHWPLNSRLPIDKSACISKRSLELSLKSSPAFDFPIAVKSITLHVAAWAEES